MCNVCYRLLENKIFFELKSEGYRDGIKEKRQDRDGALVTAHNGITQVCNAYKSMM